MKIKNEMLLFALNASFAHQALGVLTLAAYVNSHINDEVYSVLECNINERDDEIFYKLYENAKNKKIVGFSCYIWNVEKMLKFAGNLKKLLPEMYIVFGGPEVSYYNKEDFYSLYPFVDCLVQGEGEEPLLELIKKPLSRTKFENERGRRRRGFAELYKSAENYYTIYYESSRGCPFNCSYCISGIKNIKVQAKSVDVVLDELKIIEEKYYNCENSKINIIKFCDRTFNFDIKRANELYKNLINRADVYKTYNKKLLPYQFEIYPNLFNEESFEILKNAPKDLFHMEIGVQSLNTRTLESIGRKNANINQALENIARIKSLNNIPVHVDLIVGLPYEDVESFINGFNLLYEKTKADFIQIGFLKLLRGTRIRKEAEIHSYIYEESPPYTVIQNSYMSFKEIAFLRDIEKMYKRYSSNAYTKSFNYIYNTYFIGNVFEIFKLLAEYWRNNKLFDKSVSQKDAFEAFFNVFGNSGIFDRNELADLLEDDYYEHDGKKLKIKQ
jgi:radical SAM superfamily enzyme YgiQ (UPF0313 family)